MHAIFRSGRLDISKGFNALTRETIYQITIREPEPEQVAHQELDTHEIGRLIKALISDILENYVESATHPGGVSNTHTSENTH